MKSLINSVPTRQIWSNAISVVVSRLYKPEDLIKSIRIYRWLSLTKSVSDGDGGGGGGGGHDRGFRVGSSALDSGQRRTGAAAARLGEQTKQLFAEAHADEGVQERVEAAVREAQALGHKQSCSGQEDGLAAFVDAAVQVVHRLQDRDDVVG